MFTYLLSIHILIEKSFIMTTHSFPFISILAGQKPDAIAEIHGNDSHPLLYGIATFYDLFQKGVLVQVEVFHLPDQDEPGTSGFFGMHIHENGDCTPPFDKTGSHYNPENEMHPEHAGDMPPLLSHNGYAWMAFLDDRFALKDIIGRSLVIHSQKDDFTTQPSGNSGDKIGCGVIRA